MTKQIINKQDIAKSFGRAAQSYDSVAHFQRWVGQTLLESSEQASSSLDNVETAAPGIVVDLGCGTGYFSDALRETFSDATYLGVDLSEDMLRYASAHHGSDKAVWVTGDAERLPFADNSIDLIFSSLAIQWCADLPGLFREIRRVLSPNGRFMFSTLLDGSLKELKLAWAEVDGTQQHVNEFPFPVEYQSAIEVAGLRCELFDEQTKVLEYQKVNELTRELKLLGAHNITSDRPKNLTGKARIKAFVAAYEQFRMENNLLPASYQVLFGLVAK